MATSKVVAAFIAPQDARWQGAMVNVCEDGSWWLYHGANRWEEDAPPLPVKVAPDAQLLLAAPDLYAALSEIVAEWGFPNTPKWHRAQAALDKAEGKLKGEPSRG